MSPMPRSRAKRLRTRDRGSSGVSTTSCTVSPSGPRSYLRDAVGAPSALEDVEPDTVLAGALDRRRYDAPMIASQVLLAVTSLVNLHGDHELSQERAKVMILGVYHFDSPNLDFVTSTKVDHLSEEKQAEIAEVLDRLAAFAPTKIVLEATPEDGRIEERYQAFRKDACKLTGDEREQLGFQLAKQFDHPRVYLADHASNMDLDSVLKAARDSGDERFLSWFDGTMTDVRAQLERQSRSSVREALVMLNEPASQDRTSTCSSRASALASTTSAPRSWPPGTGATSASS